MPPRHREVLLPYGWRRFLPLVALLLGRPAAAGRICFLVDALPKPKIDSHAVPPIYEMASQELGSIDERYVCR